MIVSQSETHLISSFPNVDKNSLWAFDIETGEIQNIPLGPANFITLHPGTNDLFAAVHHYSGERAEISIRNVTRPAESLAKLEIHGQVWRFEGDDEAWPHLPRLYTIYYTPAITSDPIYYLVQILPGGRAIELTPLEWYERAQIELYGGIVSVTELPDQEHIVYEIARAPKPLWFYSKVKNRITKHLKLTGKTGVERCIRIHEPSLKLWTSDFDRMFQLELGRWFGYHVTDQLEVQPQVSNEPQYVGQFTFTQDWKTCVIARPFRGDVLLVDTEDFKITGRAMTGHQPRAAVMLKNGQIFARDWHTGQLLQSEFSAT
jgi:hypothetical protein